MFTNILGIHLKKKHIFKNTSLILFSNKNNYKCFKFWIINNSIDYLFYAPLLFLSVIKNIVNVLYLLNFNHKFDINIKFS